MSSCASGGKRHRRRHGTKKVAGRRRKHSVRGGGYGFGGSILGDAGGTNAGAAQWNQGSTGCGGASVASRGGNNTLAGGRRKRRHGGRVTRRRKYRRGGGAGLALTQPRGGYTFNGSGIGGFADAVPVGGKTVPV